MKKLLKFGIVSLSVATLSGFLPGQLNQGLTEQLTVYAEDGQADSTSTETEGSVTETKEESVTDSVSPEDKVVEEVEAEGAEEVAEEETVDDSSTSASDQVSGPVEIITADPEPLHNPSDEPRVIKLGHWLYGQPEFSEVSIEPGQSIDLKDYVKTDESVESYQIYKGGNQYRDETKNLGEEETRVHYDDVAYHYQRDDYNIYYVLKKEKGDEETHVRVSHTPDVPIYSEEEVSENRFNHRLLDREDVIVLQKDNPSIITAKDIDGWEYLGWELAASSRDRVYNSGKSREFILDESVKNFRDPLSVLDSRIEHFDLYFLYKPVTEAARKVAQFEPKTVTVDYLLKKEDGSLEPLATETQEIKAGGYVSDHYTNSDNHWRYTYEPIDESSRELYYHEIEDGSKFSIPVKLRDKDPIATEDESYLEMTFTNIPNMSQISPYLIGEDSSSVILRLKKGEPKKQFIPPATFNGKGFTGYGRVGYSAFGASGVTPELTEDLFIEYVDYNYSLGKPRYVFVYASDIFPETPLPFRHRLTDDKGSNLEVEFTKADGAKTLEVIAHLEPTTLNPAPIERLVGQDFDLYDIVVKDDKGNLLTDLNHKALVKLPVDEGKTVVKVIYLPEAGQAEELPILKQEDGFVYFEVSHFSHYGIVYEGQVTPPAPKEEVKTKTITIVEERQDVDGRVVFTKTHTFVLKPDQVETLPLDQTVDQLIRGSNIAAYNAYEDGAVIHFTTRKRPTTDEVKTKTITIVEERQDVDGKVVFTKTHTFVLKPDQVETLPLDQTVDQLIRGSNIAAYNAYEDGAVIHFTTRKRPTTDEVKTKTITIVEERQDVDGKVVFTKTHTFVLKPDQVETLPLDQTVDQLIRGSNIAAYNAYEDGAVIHFTTRKRPTTDEVKTKTITIVEERQDVDGKVVFTKTHTFVLKPDQVETLPLDQTVDQLIRGSNIAAYNAYEDGAVIHFTTRKRPITQDQTPKVLTDQDLATFAEIARLYDEVIALGGKPWDQLHGIAEIAKSGDKERMTNVLYNYENIRGFVTRLENQLAELNKAQETPKSESKDLAMIREAFAKLTKLADKKESGRTTAPVAAAQSGTEAVAKSAKAGLPATGDRGELGLLTAGLTLLLASLGLTKKRRN